jgi:flagellar biosynthesis/type III secretory pathway protein FliH
MRLWIHDLAKSSQNCCDFKSAARAMLLKQFISSLFAVTTLSCLAVAQEAPTPEAQASPTPQATPSDQDFINLPNDPAVRSTDIISDSQISLTGETLPAAESDRDYVDPNQLMPTDATPAPIDPRTLAAAGEEQERKIKIRYQQVRTKAEQDSDVASLLAKAKTATTFEGERAAYRKYYELLFKKMRKLDSSLSKKCDLMEKTYLARLAQTRVEPTIPLEPPPKPEPLAKQP